MPSLMELMVETVAEIAATERTNPPSAFTALCCAECGRRDTTLRNDKGDNTRKVCNPACKTAGQEMLELAMLQRRGKKPNTKRARKKFERTAREFAAGARLQAALDKGRSQ